MTPEFDGPWRLLSEDLVIGQRRWIMRDPGNPNRWIVKTQSWAPSLIAEGNERDRNEAAGQRFGDGRIVARIPLSILYGKELGEAFKVGDEPYIRKFLDDPNNAWMRTFGGRLT
jgi:hypothetical protein